MAYDDSLASRCPVGLATAEPTDLVLECFWHVCSML